MFLDIFQVSAQEILGLVEWVGPYRNNSKTNYKKREQVASQIFNTLSGIGFSGLAATVQWLGSAARSAKNSDNIFIPNKSWLDIPDRWP